MGGPAVLFCFSQIFQGPSQGSHNWESLLGHLVCRQIWSKMVDGNTHDFGLSVPVVGHGRVSLWFPPKFPAPKKREPASASLMFWLLCSIKVLHESCKKPPFPLDPWTWRSTCQRNVHTPLMNRDKKNEKVEISLVRAKMDVGTRGQCRYDKQLLLQ